MYIYIYVYTLSRLVIDSFYRRVYRIRNHQEYYKEKPTSNTISIYFHFFHSFLVQKSWSPAIVTTNFRLVTGPWSWGFPHPSAMNHRVWNDFLSGGFNFQLIWYRFETYNQLDWEWLWFDRYGENGQLKPPPRDSWAAKATAHRMKHHTTVAIILLNTVNSKLGNWAVVAIEGVRRLSRWDGWKSGPGSRFS